MMQKNWISGRSSLFSYIFTVLCSSSKCDKNANLGTGYSLGIKELEMQKQRFREIQSYYATVILNTKRHLRDTIYILGDRPLFHMAFGSTWLDLLKTNRKCHFKTAQKHIPWECPWKQLLNIVWYLYQLWTWSQVCFDSLWKKNQERSASDVAVRRITLAIVHIGLLSSPCVG